MSAPQPNSRETIEACLAQGRPALMVYLPVGYPTVSGSIAAMEAVIDAGADIVEVGMPYSDPVMDGTVIQAAATTALERGVRVDHVFEAVAAVRAAGAHDRADPALITILWPHDF